MVLLTNLRYSCKYNYSDRLGLGSEALRSFLFLYQLQNFPILLASRVNGTSFPRIAHFLLSKNGLTLLVGALLQTSSDGCFLFRLLSACRAATCFFGKASIFLSCIKIGIYRRRFSYSKTVGKLR